MKHIVLSDAALACLVVRVWRARGGYVPPVRAIAVSRNDAVTLRLIECKPELHVIGSWTVHEYGDVPDMIRLLESKDRCITGLVFHERFIDRRCFWEFVDPYTLDSSHMFARIWQESYGIIGQPG